MSIRTLLLAVALPIVAVDLAAQQGWAAPTPAPAQAPTPASAAPPARGAAAAPTPRPASIASGQAGEAWVASGFSARYPQDPADSLYREARTLLNRGEWRRAATLFGQVADRRPESAYAADALYWKAFALYRIGGVAELRESLAALDARKSRFPRAGNADDAASLTTRVTGALAARGDAAASTRLRSQAAADPSSCDDEDLSVRASALSTLMRNDPESATPILLKVLDRRDQCSLSLRQNAVMILGRRDDATVRAKLVDVARNDPSADVRSGAIGYLAKANTDDMANTLDGIMRNDAELNVQRAAARALGTMTAPRAKTAIRSLIERTSAPERLRIDAIASFDRRAAINNAYTYSYNCAGGQCGDGVMIATSDGLLGVTTPRPPMPPTPATPAVAPMPPTPPMASPEARAAGEARAAARADAREAERTALATTIGSGDFRVAGWDDDERRISPEDAAWLRGVYPRLETSRLKSAAASVLARAGDDATSTWLMSLIQREEEPAEVRANVLSRLGREMPIAQLGRLYDGASGRTVRNQIVDVLGRRTEPEATDKLIEIVRTGTDPNLRRAAIAALNRKNDPRTTQLLLELIDR
jgi:HEAT repeat protein